jgi:hypothetical protein
MSKKNKKVQQRGLHELYRNDGGLIYKGKYIGEKPDGLWMFYNYKQINFYI